MKAIKGWIWLESGRLTQLCMGLLATSFLFILTIRACTDSNTTTNLHLQFQSSEPLDSSTQLLTHLQTAIEVLPSLGIYLLATIICLTLALLASRPSRLDWSKGSFQCLKLSQVSFVLSDTYRWFFLVVVTLLAQIFITLGFMLSLSKTTAFYSEIIHYSLFFLTCYGLIVLPLFTALLVLLGSFYRSYWLNGSSLITKIIHFFGSLSLIGFMVKTLFSLFTSPSLTSIKLWTIKFSQSMENQISLSLELLLIVWACIVLALVLAGKIDQSTEC